MGMRSIRVFVALVGLVGLSACASSGGQESTTSDLSEQALQIAVVTHGTPGDTFWDVVKSGAERAGSDLGVEVTYQGDGNPVAQSQLIDSAVASGADGLIISMANPEGVRDSVEAAVAAGVPVVTINSGLEFSKEFGAVTHVGQSEFLAGQAAGERLAESGAERVLCVIHEAGNSGLEQRCSGAADGVAGSVENLQVDVGNIADAQNSIQSKLLADPTIDAVLTLQPAIAVAGVQAVAGAASDAQVATFDLSADVTQAIQDDRILFAIDQQPYSQGYLPVTFLTLQARNGDIVGGGQPVYSGPGFVTKENAEQVARFAEHGTR